MAWQPKFITIDIVTLILVVNKKTQKISKLKAKLKQTKHKTILASRLSQTQTNSLLLTSNIFRQEKERNKITLYRYRAVKLSMLHLTLILGRAKLSLVQNWPLMQKSFCAILFQRSHLSPSNFDSLLYTLKKLNVIN